MRCPEEKTGRVPKIMNEKILIESKEQYVKPIGIAAVVCWVVALISLIVNLISTSKYREIDHYIEMNWTTLTAAEKDNWHRLMRTSNISKDVLIVAGVLAILLLIVYLYCHKIKLVVTDKRVYGKCAFGKQVDLPLDSISAVGIRFFQSIAIGTSSGRIVFSGIKNRDEIHRVISGLLIGRQKTQPPAPAESTAHQNEADALVRFKKLLDDGVITQEEFDAKKKQILGL